MSKQNGSNLKKQETHMSSTLSVFIHPVSSKMLDASDTFPSVGNSRREHWRWSTLRVNVHFHCNEWIWVRWYGWCNIYIWYIEYNRLYILVIWYYIYIIHMYVNIEQHDSFWLCFCHKEDLRRVAASMRRQQISIRGCMGCSSSELSG